MSEQTMYHALCSAYTMNVCEITQNIVISSKQRLQDSTTIIERTLRK